MHVPIIYLAALSGEFSWLYNKYCSNTTHKPVDSLLVQWTVDLLNTVRQRLGEYHQWHHGRQTILTLANCNSSARPSIELLHPAVRQVSQNNYNTELLLSTKRLSFTLSLKLISFVISSFVCFRSKLRSEKEREEGVVIESDWLVYEERIKGWQSFLED